MLPNAPQHQTDGTSAQRSPSHSTGVARHAPLIPKLRQTLPSFTFTSDDVLPYIHIIIYLYRYDTFKNTLIILFGFGLLELLHLIC